MFSLTRLTNIWVLVCCQQSFPCPATLKSPQICSLTHGSVEYWKIKLAAPAAERMSEIMCVQPCSPANLFCFNTSSLCLHFSMLHCNTLPHHLILIPLLVGRISLLYFFLIYSFCIINQFWILNTLVWKQHPFFTKQIHKCSYTAEGLILLIHGVDQNQCAFVRLSCVDLRDWSPNKQMSEWNARLDKTEGISIC